MAMSLTQLQMLARERLPSKRHELLRALADALFEPSRGLSDRERDLFDDIIKKVLDDVEPLARQEFAERLAGRPDAPHCVVRRLAGDIIAIAAPVLTRSPLLGEDDLALLAWGKSQDHLLAIARRVELSERITDILVDRGDGLVLDSIAENIGARFSESGAATLIEKARLRESLWRRLADRADLAMYVADALTPALGEAIAVEAARRGVGMDAARSRALLQETRESLAARLHAAAARARPLDELADLVAGGNLRLCEAVVELADADRVADVAILVCGSAAGSSHDFVRHLFAPDEAPLMTACRAALLDLKSFSAVLRLRRRRRPFGAGDVGRMLRAYQALPVPCEPVVSSPPWDADGERCRAPQGLRRPPK